MTAQDLKNSILQLAMQGKLVPQNPEDVSVDLSDLKLKKTDDYEFDIPNNWRQAHLETITTVVPSKQYQILESEVKQVGKFPVVSQSKSYSIGFTDNDEKVYCHENPVIIFGDHTTEIKFIDFDFVVGADGVKIFEPLDFVIIAKFLFYVLQFYSRDLNKVGGYSRHYKFIKNKPIPLPPLEEQKRIVTKIEELLPYVEEYDKVEKRLLELNDEFPDKLCKSILQQAVQGKLTECHTDNEPASELLNRISEEKAKLVAEGKVYREKELKPISNDEIPFDIPDDWTWCKLGELTRLITKGSSPSWQGVSYTTEDNGILFVTSENVGTGNMLLEKRKYVEAKFNKMHPSSILQKGDLLTNIVGASIGRTAVFEEDIKNANINQAVCIIRLVDRALSEYLLMYLNSATAIHIMTAKSVDSARANLSLTSVTNLLVPLPPLAEQKRIVARVEQLLAVCDNLK